MKSIFIYLLVFIGFLIPTGLNSLHASNCQGLNSPDQQNHTDVKKQQMRSQQGEGEGEGGEGGEGEEEENERNKKKAQEKQRQKRQMAKTEDSSFGMLKDIFQNTFDFFYAPDSTKSEGVGRQR